MPLLADRVKESTTTVGTGTITLAGAPAGFVTFNSVFANGATCYYVIQGGADWEIGIGTVGTGTLARTTVLQSSNADALVPFAAGVKDVFVSYVADRAVTTSDAATLTSKVVDSITNLVGADHIHYKIKATAPITKGQTLKVTGYNAGESAIEVAPVSSASDVAVGIAYQALNTGEFGAAINTGLLTGVKTDYAGWALGDILYPDPATGGLTKTKPASGTYQACAYVMRVQANNGVLLCEFTEPAPVTATANTANTVVARDGSGNFAAGTITANLSGNVTGNVTGNADTATKLSTARTFAVTGDITGSVSSDLTSGASIATAIASGVIVNDDINASAAIADTKLATISTAGKVANSATTATDTNTASAIVARDASGNFAAGTITAALSGNASTATALQTARTINGVSFDGTANITVAAAAGTLTGTTLASNVTASSLTSVGTLTSGAIGTGFTAIPNTALANSSVTVNGVSIALGASGTVAAAAGTLTGTTLASNVVSSSLTSVGTLTNLTVTNPISGSVTGSSGSTTGNAATATALQTARTINGVSFDGTANITVAAAAGTLTGSTLASGVTASSLTSVGTLSSLAVSGNLAVNTNALFVDAGNKRVGVGTASPSYALQVDGVSTAGFVTPIVAKNPSTNAASGAKIAFDGGGAVWGEIGASYNSNSPYMAFFVRAGSEKMRIDDSGNLGIGTSSPSARLHVKDSTGTAVTLLRLESAYSNPSGNKSILWTDATDALGRISVSYTAAGGSQMSFGSLYNGGYQTSDLMTLNSSGNLAVDTNTLYVDAVNNRVGVGTASPGFTFTTQHTFPATFTNAAGDYATMVRSGGTSENWLGVAGQTTTDKWVGLITNGSPAPSLVLGTGGAEAMRIDASRNVGLGVTPSAWGGKKTIEVGYAGTALTTFNQTTAVFTQNAYHDGSWKYGGTGAAMLYSLEAGAHKWFTASSGTAGAAISFTQAMTLDASGNLIVGATSGPEAFNVKRGAGLSAYAEFAGNNNGLGSASMLYGQDGGNNGYVWNRANAPVLFATNGTERARITAGGALCVGATSAPAAAPKFYVESNAVPAIYGKNTGAGGYTFNSDAASNGGTYYHFNFLDAGTSHGSISSNGTNTAYNTSSDVRLKKNIADAAPCGTLIDAIAIRQFDWKSNDRHQRYGVIAQEVEAVFPEMVTKGQTEEDMWGVDYSTLVPMLVKEIQSLRGRVAALEA